MWIPSCAWNHTTDKNTEMYLLLQDVFCHVWICTYFSNDEKLIPEYNSFLDFISVFQREDDRVSKANELSLANVGGVFVVLLAGMGLACLIAVFEFIWKSRKLATEDNVRHNQLICKGFSHTSKHSFLISKSRLVVK